MRKILATVLLLALLALGATACSDMTSGGTKPAAPTAAPAQSTAEPAATDAAPEVSATPAA